MPPAPATESDLQIYPVSDTNPNLSMNFFVPALSIVIALLAAVGNSAPYFSAFSEECGKWASVDGECIKNSAFMWSRCFESCLKAAVDDDERCEGWAQEGECTNNPNYIQVHCPQSCKKAIAWNPWTRATLGKIRINIAWLTINCV